MDCYADYFNYAMHCVCGIPSVTITGTVADWQQIRARVEVLATYDLEWWVKRMRPILDEFVLAAQGQPNPLFWKAIYKPTQAYIGDRITGWVAHMFPYLKDPPDRCRNSALEFDILDPNADPEEHLKMGVSEKMFPSGLSSVPVTITGSGFSGRKLDFVGGFFGVEQHELSLSPVISWALCKMPPVNGVRL